MSKSSKSVPSRPQTLVPPRASQQRRAPARPASKGPAARQAALVRRRRNMMAGGAVVAVIAVVAVVVGLGLSSSSSQKPAPRVALTATQQAHLTSIPLSTLVSASSEGPASSLLPAYEIDSSPYTSAGKPAILYIGAEFCPICATERWPMVVALSQFGTFGNLSQTRSAVRDGNIATLSFYGSTYTSNYLSFTPVEAETNIPKGNSYVPLQTPTPAQTQLWTSTLGSESFPFIYVGGKYVLDTYQYPETVVQGKTFAQIASDVGNNNTLVGASVDAAAAALVKYICNITGQKPAATCQAVAGVKAPVTKVAKSGPSSSSNG
jgi:hypothetical protein